VGQRAAKHGTVFGALITNLGIMQEDSVPLGAMAAKTTARKIKTGFGVAASGLVPDARPKTLSIARVY